MINIEKLRNEFMEFNLQEKINDKLRGINEPVESEL